MTPALAVFPLLALAGDCRPVSGPRLLGSDLAQALPELAALPGDLFVGYSPAPGLRRILRAPELERIARPHGVDVPPRAQACFEWPLASLAPERLLEAMRTALERPEAKIEILDYDHHPMPSGPVIFPRSSLAPQPFTSNGVVWRGYVQYAENRRAQTWAMVRISARATRVVAAQLLRNGEPIRADQVKLETTDAPAFDSQAAETLAEVIGKVPRRTLATGSIVERNLLGPAREIAKGESVKVDVKNGAVRFQMEGRAESSGHRGEIIQVRNLSSGKNFRARVEGPGRVSVLGVSPGGVQ
ncbi:MAG: flagellar basal body P-ring formation protein FlgA [Candidatus Solibacter usitatus]|nr:flagellar basal body P-ring formation protein FlgA [Candidatus Solibacter usitatus]